MGSPCQASIPAKSGNEASDMGSSMSIAYILRGRRIATWDPHARQGFLPKVLPFIDFDKLKQAIRSAESLSDKADVMRYAKPTDASIRGKGALMSVELSKELDVAYYVLSMQHFLRQRHSKEERVLKQEQFQNRAFMEMDSQRHSGDGHTRRHSILTAYSGKPLPYLPVHIQKEVDRLDHLTENFNVKLNLIAALKGGVEYLGLHLAGDLAQVLNSLQKNIYASNYLA